MNIFYLDHQPKKAAQLHCDKHIVKMILEYAQLLSTAHRLLDGKLVDVPSKRNPAKMTKVYQLEDYDHLIYKATHRNHPSAVWVRESKANYLWLYDLFRACCEEYTARYDRIHLTDEKLSKILSEPPFRISDGSFTPPPQCMPDEYKQDDTVMAYRAYYRGDKKDIAVWRFGVVPEFMGC